MKPRALTLREFHRRFPDEAAARAWFEQARWPDGPTCSHCALVNRARPVSKKPASWDCLGCKKRFSITSGTPMHQTHLPLLTWLQGIYLVVASSKGISAVKLGEMLGISYPSAWFMGHRIRTMMAQQSPLLSGIVEIDEMYAGAPPRKRAKSSRDHDGDDDAPKNPPGRGTKRPLVLVVAERGGDVVAKVIPTHGKAAIAEALDGVLDPSAVVMTDGLPAYKHIGHKQDHQAVKHSSGEYARTDERGRRVHVNRVESFNGFMRRAVVGVWHQIGVKHLGRYASEAAFRWNQKKNDVLDRMSAMVRNGDGRMLSYAFLTAKAA